MLQRRFRLGTAVGAVIRIRLAARYGQQTGGTVLA